MIEKQIRDLFEYTENKEITKFFEEISKIFLESNLFSLKIEGEKELKYINFEKLKSILKKWHNSNNFDISYLVSLLKENDSDFYIFIEEKKTKENKNEIFHIEGLRPIKKNKLKYFVGREKEKEILKVITSKKVKNNCIVFGEAGVGKT